MEFRWNKVIHHLCDRFYQAPHFSHAKWKCKAKRMPSFQHLLWILQVVCFASPTLGKWLHLCYSPLFETKLCIRNMLKIYDFPWSTKVAGSSESICLVAKCYISHYYNTALITVQYGHMATVGHMQSHTLWNKYSISEDERTVKPSCVRACSLAAPSGSISSYHTNNNNVDSLLLMWIAFNIALSLWLHFDFGWHYPFLDSVGSRWLGTLQGSLFLPQVLDPLYNGSIVVKCS